MIQRQTGSLRQLIQLLVIVMAASLLVAACGGSPAGPADEPAAEADSGSSDESSSDSSDGEMASDGQYKEAPMLAEMVAAGDLPSVEERLPTEPMVIEPVN
ncbi:hypothetical protein KFU94_51250 [Chloroflexi bacterium TSY]|nr:hypothetical protein [Chloroflexi bacterium TSY]